ncbi:unnamed protein product [Rotaria socialis]|uniref:Uncharacterized protein n=1 Tax=Rotaria socialis TaxID=392032 RepID=A0A818GEZ6_9BILA|nr:unnamed protein product [Rotaria socialis]
MPTQSLDQESIHSDTLQLSIWPNDPNRSLSSNSNQFESSLFTKSQAWDKPENANNGNRFFKFKRAGGYGELCCCSNYNGCIVGLVIGLLLGGVCLATILAMWLTTSSTTTTTSTTITTTTITTTTTTTVTTTTTTTTITTTTTTSTTTTTTTTSTTTTTETSTTTTTTTASTTTTDTSTTTTVNPTTCTIGACSPTETVLDFNAGGVLPVGYGNFTWTGANILNGATHTPMSGYHVVACGGPYVIYTSGTITMKRIPTGTTFGLNSFLATAAWYDNLNLTISGQLSGTVIYAANFILQVFSITIVNLNWYGIDTMSLTTSGGTKNINVSSTGKHVAIDNMCVTY